MRIAVVGTGVSGLVCAYLLQRDHDLVVYEAEGRIGGHVHTVPVELGGRRYAVDTGFIVFNRRTYPAFCRLLERLEVASQPTEMSFSVQCERTGLEYNGGSLGGLLAQPSNLLRPGFRRMLRDVPRFYRDASRLLERPDPKPTLSDMLAAGRYSKEFVELHLLPMGAAIWSSDLERMRDFPALTFARFFHNHGLLQLRDRPVWRVVRGGSERYVDALCAGFRRRIRTGTAVRSLRRRGGGVELWTARGGPERFDEVIVATHSDQALRLLAEPTDAERAVLGAIRTQPNEAVLHTDASLLPERPRARASWNVLVPREPQRRVAVTYSMNRLQGLEAPVELCVTLNRDEAVRPERVIRRIRYAHPVFDARAVEAQGHRSAICGVEGLHFCGAWWGYGFHEDGVASALEVTRRFGRDLSE
jgi:predicted NAD/FAD-binding protein